MTTSSRRGFIRGAAAASLLAASGIGTAASTDDKAAAGVAFGDEHSPTPLPFDPKALNGLSAKLVQSHWENNYGGAVKALNTLRGRLAQAFQRCRNPALRLHGAET